MKRQIFLILGSLFLLPILLLISCSDSGTNPTPTEVESDLELEFYRIVNGEEDDYFTKSVFLELDGEEYESTSGRFSFDNIEHGDYPITISYREFSFQDTIEINSNYHRFKMGDEFYESIPIQVYEVVEQDTVLLQRGGFQSHGNYQDAKNGDTFRVYRAHKGDEVNVSIHSPHFETIHLSKIFESDNLHKFYIKPDEIVDIKGKIQLTDRGKIYPLSNFDFTADGQQITTDQHGEFQLDFFNTGTARFIFDHELINETEITKKIFSFTQPGFELTSPTADFYPLEVGNTWTYDVLSQASITGHPDSKADFKAKWEVLSKSIQENTTIYELAEIRNGMKIKYYMSDTTYYENEIDTLQIIHYEDDTLEFPDFYGFEKNGVIRKSNPSFFEEINITSGVAGSSEPARTTFKKGVGVTYFNDFKLAHSGWSKTIELIDYELNN